MGYGFGSVLVLQNYLLPRDILSEWDPVGRDLHPQVTFEGLVQRVFTVWWDSGWVETFVIELLHLAIFHRSGYHFYCVGVLVSSVRGHQ